MNHKYILPICLLVYSLTSAAQGSYATYRSLVESGKLDAAVTEGIAIKERLKHEGKYPEMFEILRDMDAAILRREEETNRQMPQLHYRVEKERLYLYLGWMKKDYSKQRFELLTEIASKLRGDSLMEDWLQTKADYYLQYGKAEQCTQCYAKLLEMRRKGKSQAETGKQFEDVIALAAKKSGMVSQAIASMYQAWKDSVAAASMAAELNGVQQQYEASQTALAERESVIKKGELTIKTLTFVAVVLAGLLGVFILLWLGNTVVLKRVRRQLKAAEEGNTRKAGFIRQISSQMMPMVQRVTPNTVGALQAYLQDVETFASLEVQTEKTVATEEYNIHTLCEDIVNAVRASLPADLVVSVSAPSTRFRFDEQTVHEIMQYILRATVQQEGTQKLQVEFKKRGAHQGSFILTNYGGSLTDEQRDSIFVAFQPDHCPGDESGLGYPICALRAKQMGGELLLDNEFRKGTRFVLKVEE
ncbi:MAG: ATP-binding protein [Bacteroidaceae bacterium]|nr:ATP-binding protein [Bacteroidaceae bacterium]